MLGDPGQMSDFPLSVFGPSDGFCFSGPEDQPLSLKPVTQTTVESAGVTNRSLSLAEQQAIGVRWVCSGGGVGH